MAFQSQQNFNFQGRVPMASIMEAYQNKAKQEYQMKLQAEQQKQQKIQQTMGIINQASQLVQQGVQMSNKRQQKEARTVFATMFADKDTTVEQKREGYLKAYPQEGYKEVGKSLWKDPMSEKDKALVDKYKAETAFLKQGKPRQFKSKSDVEIREQADKDALAEHKSANKYGTLMDENYLIKVKQRADELYKERKALKDFKGKLGYIKLIDPFGVPGNVSIADWTKRKPEYLKEGYSRIQ